MLYTGDFVYWKQINNIKPDSDVFGWVIEYI